MANIMEIVRAAMSRSPSVDGGGNVAKGIKPPGRTAPDVPLTPFATFAPPSPWDQERASHMMYDADTLVEHLGVNGLEPEIQRAATMVVTANANRDTEKFMFAIIEFEAVVRRAALPGGKDFKTRVSICLSEATVWRG